MKIKQIVLAVGILVFWLTGSNADDLLYDNGLNAGTIVTIGTSDYDANPDTGNIRFFADDFLLSQPSVVNSVSWTGVYYPGRTPPKTDDFEISFYVDDGSGLLPVEDAFAVFELGNEVGRTDSGFDLAGIVVFEYSASFADLTLDPNTKYWLSIRNATFNDPDDAWWWGGEAGTGNAASQLNGSNWMVHPASIRFDFQLHGMAPGQSDEVLIPVPNIAKFAFDSTRNHLLATTTTGQIYRYDVASRTELPPFAVGIDLSGGIDVTDDGAFAYVGERIAGATQGIVRKVDLNTGVKTNLFYDLTSREQGVWELQITNNNKAFFTVDATGSGSATKIREIDLTTDIMTDRGNVTQWTGIAHGPDRSILFFQQGNISSGPILTYAAATDDFPTFRHTNMFVGDLPAAVSRDGSLIAFKDSLLSSATLDLVELIPGGARGFAFDPVQDILYMTRDSEVIAYSIPDVIELLRIPICEVGTRITTNSRGSLIFVGTPMGVRMISNPLTLPACASGGAILTGSGEINDFESTCSSDDSYWAAHGSSLFYQVSVPVVQFEITASTVGFSGNAISLDVEASKENDNANLNLRALLYNFATDNYVALPGVMPLTTTDQIKRFELPEGASPGDFIEPGTSEIRSLLQTIQTSGLPNVRTQLDSVLFNIE